MLVTLAQEANDAYLIFGFILLGVAIVLLFLELLVPSGGLIGMLCGVAAIGSVVSFWKFDQTWGFVSLLLYLVLAPIVIVFVFKLWLHSPIAKRMILGGGEPVVGNEDTAAAAEQARRERLAQLQQLIGAEGVTVTSLRPVGVVKIAGERVDALSESGIIPVSTPVIVTDVYDNQIKVRPK